MNKIRLLTTSCAVAYLSATSPALAQSEPAPASDIENKTPEEIVVTGIRASIQRAQEIKRKSSTVVEAITAEDLGKFSDNSVADALSRVPGAQITRSFDGVNGDSVSLRGLGSGYTVQTLNGRSLLSSGAAGSGIRGFNLDQIPTEILGGVLIHKTSEADLVENGLAGLIDYQTLRPLDHSARRGPLIISLTGRGDYDSEGKKFSPRFSGTIIGRNPSETVGAVLSVNWTHSKIRADTINGLPQRYDIRQNEGAGIVTTPKVAAYDELNVIVNNINTRRLTVAGGIQLKPTDSLEIFVDGSYNKYDRTPINRIARYILGYGGVYDGVFGPGGVAINNGHVTRVDASKVTGGSPTQCYDDFFGQSNGCVLLSDSRSANQLKEKVIGGNIKWGKDKLKIILDGAHSSVNYRIHLNSWYNYSPEVIGGFVNSGSDPTSLLLDAADKATILNTAAYSNPWFFGQEQAARKFRDELRLDLAYSFSPNFTLKAGARYERTKEDYRNAQLSFAAALYGGGVPPEAFGKLPGAYFTGRTISAFGLTFPDTSGPGACSVSGGICDVTPSSEPYFNGPLPTSSQFANANGYQFDPSISRIFKERTIALYSQMDAKGTLFGWDASGNIGLRALNIRDDGEAYQGVRVLNNPSVASPVSQDYLLVSRRNDFWEFLPSLNFNLHPTQNTSLRLGVARVVSLNDVGALSPAASVSIYDPKDPSYNPAVPGFGSSGNINLRPTSSWNFDLTGEYYTSRRGSIVVSLFYKAISNFVLGEQQSRVPLPGFPGLVFDLSRPTNYSGAKAYGFEIGTYQPFTFLPSPLDGLGFQGNYTYVYSKLDRASAGVTYGIPGSSKHNANAILFYEKGPVGLRAALSYRNDYFLFLGNPGYGGNFTRFEEGGTNLDLSASFKFSRNVSAQLQAANVTKRRQFRYSFDKSFPISVYATPATYSAGLSVTF